MSAPAAILDIDGTLVDTNYHHAIAWYRAFLQSGVTLPLWKVHRHSYAPESRARLWLSATCYR